MRSMGRQVAAAHRDGGGATAATGLMLGLAAMMFLDISLG